MNWRLMTEPQFSHRLHICPCHSVNVRIRTTLTLLTRGFIVSRNDVFASEMAAQRGAMIVTAVSLWVTLWRWGQKLSLDCVCSQLTFTRGVSPGTLEGSQSFTQLCTTLCAVVVVVYLDAILFHQLHQLWLQCCNLPRKRKVFFLKQIVLVSRYWWCYLHFTVGTLLWSAFEF